MQIIKLKIKILYFSKVKSFNLDRQFKMKLIITKKKILHNLKLINLDRLFKMI